MDKLFCFGNCSRIKPILERWNKIIANYPQVKEKYEKDLIKWKEDAEKAKDKG